MDEFQSEKEQVEELRKWWSENGRFVIAGLVLGVAILGGWRYWTDYRNERAEQGSERYSRLMGAIQQSDREAALGLGTELREQFDDTPYAILSGLAVAKLYVDEGAPEDAADELRYVLDHAAEEELSHVARLRLARVLLEQGDTGQARELLQVAEVGDFAARYNVVRGDIELASGDEAAARLEYQQALATSAVGVVDRNMVQMKLDALGVEDTAEMVAGGEEEPAS